MEWERSCGDLRTPWEFCTPSKSLGSKTGELGSVSDTLDSHFHRFTLSRCRARSGSEANSSAFGLGFTTLLGFSEASLGGYKCFLEFDLNLASWKRKKRLQIMPWAFENSDSKAQADVKSSLGTLSPSITGAFQQASPSCFTASNTVRRSPANSTSWTAADSKPFG